MLLEESILGWKEFELELMRDRHDNVVVVCSIENIDPMGVHTGDSVTVAPAMTLTDREYQHMRDVAIAVIRAVGVDTGGCNIQFAVHPQTGRMVVIEMNPRVSRSSALASKATGFPIAKIAARLAIGYTLDEIRNDITGETPASFEPALDYVVVKVPRFAFEKFPGADPVLTTHMKSVGEAMAIGRSFPEALQKALRSLESRGAPLSWREAPGDPAELLARCAVPHDGRLAAVHQAIRAGVSVPDLAAATGIDAWFIDQIKAIEEHAERLASAGPPTAATLRAAKQAGFSDSQIADICGIAEERVRRWRHDLGVRPVYHTVDTCAAEFEARTPYLYSTYDEQSEVPAGDRPKVIILGSGPNRIGQGIEFDYACVHACFALSEAGYETVMVNCNPETVSTDYDTSDRLYFEPLTLEDVLEVVHAEQANGPVAGVIVQLGGQTPLGLARALAAAGVPVVGTSPEAIHLAEHRGEFGALLAAAGLPAPRHGTAASAAAAKAVAAGIGYPVLVRPSYVLGGRGMEIVYDDDTLEAYVGKATEASPEHPVLIDRFLDDAIEIDVDALFDGEELYLAGVMEHIEEAGIHSGDSVNLPSDRDRTIAVVLSRRDPEYTDAERDLLNRARPLLIQAFRAAIEADRVRSALADLSERADLLGPLRDAGLTPREAEVMRLVALGRSNRHIAAELGTSDRTVGKHLERGFRKLGVTSRSEAAQCAWGLLPAARGYRRRTGHRRPGRGRPAGAARRLTGDRSALQRDLPRPRGPAHGRQLQRRRDLAVPLQRLAARRPQLHPDRGLLPALDRYVILP